MADGDPQLRMEISALGNFLQSLTYEVQGIGNSVGRIADHYTGIDTGYASSATPVSPSRTTAADSVQSSSGPHAVDPEEPKPDPSMVMVDTLLRQVAVDRAGSPYWGSDDRVIDLDAVESYLLSLKDHLS